MLSTCTLYTYFHQQVQRSRDAIVETFVESPPDWIVLVSRPVHEYGYVLFGVCTTPE